MDPGQDSLLRVLQVDDRLVRVALGGAAAQVLDADRLVHQGADADAAARMALNGLGPESGARRVSAGWEAAGWEAA